MIKKIKAAQTRKEVERRKEAQNREVGKQVRSTLGIFFFLV